MALRNLFETEALILERLREQIPELKTVCDFSAIPSDVEITQQLPAVFLEDGGAEEIEGTARVTNCVRERQVWIATVAVPYARDGNQTPEWLEGAGAYLSRVYQALHDWTAGNGARLAYVKRDEAIYFDGHIECPVHFAAGTTLDWPE